jgi:squalene-hopene/tetraprenyl-beta-curcumene cyclase
MNFIIDDFTATLTSVRNRLLQERNEQGHWEGQLSSSALSTATASVALSLFNHQQYRQRIHQGLDWLAHHQNADGGWGDSVLSPSNISTTTLVWAAYAVANDESEYQETIDKATRWIVNKSNGLDFETIANTITACYGEDRTFSIPILTHCILSGRFDSEKANWKRIKSLPFEFSLAPFWCLKWLRITVVSYALPALIAMGQVKHFHYPSRNLFVRMLRNLTRTGTLRKLEEIQPESGGFLEATPLTSFVVMSLVSSNEIENPVVIKGIDFLLKSQRDNGSWPIDTNLATWGTTLSINALAINSTFHDFLTEDDRMTLTNWLLQQQNRGIHPYTRAGAGGWAWTNLPGGVPDADDTAGALLALHNLRIQNTSVQEAVTLGIEWFLQLQNSDGGIPTFCRGWGKLPFDQSAPDLSAHFLLAMMTWSESGNLPNSLSRKVTKAIDKNLQYLKTMQRSDGSWIPLWFGNPQAPGEENPVYGTSIVISALSALNMFPDNGYHDMLFDGVKYLLHAHNKDQGWGGANNVTSSIEETALAVNALSQTLAWSKNRQIVSDDIDIQCIKQSIVSGTSWIMTNTKYGTEFHPSPIGLYFARLWYYEKLYPIIFTTRALERVKSIMHFLDT